MRISILCSSQAHPVFPYLETWQHDHGDVNDIELVERNQALGGGNILFLISCNEIISKRTRGRYDATLVVHASDLPKGRGWSPHIWQVLEGQREIVVTLLEAEDDVDVGAIWTQRRMVLGGHELWDEINEKLFAIELELMDFAVANFNSIEARPQSDVEPTYYRRRKPSDSQIDPQRSIAEQFEMLRVADPERYPAVFDMRGYRYRITLTKLGRLEG